MPQHGSGPSAPLALGPTSPRRAPPGLRLSETGGLPLAAIRDGAASLTRVGPTLRAALPSLAPEAERELAGGARRLLAESMGRGLTRFLMRTNPDLPIPGGWHGAVEVLCADLLGNLVGRLATTADVEDVLASHQARLRGLLAVREAGDPSNFDPVCASYTPDLQARFLGLDPVRTPGPVLDLGCGEDGALVRHLRGLGRDDVSGVGVLCETSSGLIIGAASMRLVRSPLGNLTRRGNRQVRRQSLDEVRRPRH